MAELKLRYSIRGYDAQKNCYNIIEYNGSIAVNEYSGYYKGNYFSLYPKRRIAPSRVDIKRKDVSIFKIKKEG